MTRSPRSAWARTRPTAGRVDLQALVDYIGANSPVTPDYAQRSVGVTATPPADGVAYQAGESVTLGLSSMLFSNGGATSGDATVSLGGTVLGTAPLAFTIVDTLDEQGTASVAVTIPDGVVGSQLLTIEGPGGTSVQLPIEIAAAPEPVDTSLRGSLNRLLVLGNQSVTYRVTATAADGSVPVGTVTVYDGTKVLTTIELDAADGGKGIGDAAEAEPRHPPRDGAIRGRRLRALDRVPVRGDRAPIEHRSERIRVDESPTAPRQWATPRISP